MIDGGSGSSGGGVEEFVSILDDNSTCKTGKIRGCDRNRNPLEKSFIDDGVVEIYTASVEGKVMNRTIEIESVLGEFSREIAKALGLSEDEVCLLYTSPSPRD